MLVNLECFHCGARVLETDNNVWLDTNMEGGWWIMQTAGGFHYAMAYDNKHPGVRGYQLHKHQPVNGDEL